MRKYNEKMIIRNGKMKYYCCYFKPYGYGKTYYEINKSLKELKQRIKQVLDKKESCETSTEILKKINDMLEDYENRYLKKETKVSNNE